MVKNESFADSSTAIQPLFELKLTAPIQLLTILLVRRDVRLQRHRDQPNAVQYSMGDDVRH